MKQRNCWHIKCNNTPEIIDRIILPIRKRGLKVLSLNFRHETDEIATCTLEFEETALTAEQIFKNLSRTYDIIEINRQ